MPIIAQIKQISNTSLKKNNEERFIIKGPIHQKKHKHQKCAFDQ